MPHRILAPIDRCVSPRDLGYPLQAFITAVVDQHRLDEVIKQLQTIAQVTQVTGISGVADLLIAVVATDADDLYRVAGLVLAVPRRGAHSRCRWRCTRSLPTAPGRCWSRSHGGGEHESPRPVVRVDISGRARCLGDPVTGPLCEQWPGHGPPSTAPG